MKLVVFEYQKNKLEEKKTQGCKLFNKRANKNILSDIIIINRVFIYERERE